MCICRKCAKIQTDLGGKVCGKAMLPNIHMIEYVKWLLYHSKLKYVYSVN